VELIPNNLIIPNSNSNAKDLWRLSNAYEFPDDERLNIKVIGLLTTGSIHNAQYTINISLKCRCGGQNLSHTGLRHVPQPPQQIPSARRPSTTKIASSILDTA